MKKISKLVLNDLSRKELSQKQMGKIKGGNTCGCGCCYYPSGGGYPDYENGNANCKLGWNSTCGLVALASC